MSDGGDFLSRWSRLKRQSEENDRPETQAQTGEPGPTPFDPASLPSIESLTADSDIQAFLQLGVPPELTRAALRSIWQKDPAIRDFVGIADSQWDFNDPTAMPGFSPLEDVSLAQRLQASRVARLPSALEVLKRTGDVEPAQADRAAPQRDGQVDKVWRTAGASAADPSADSTRFQPSVSRPEVEPAADEATQLTTTIHRHGSALPK
jgi:hypothetical protein